MRTKEFKMCLQVVPLFKYILILNVYVMYEKQMLEYFLLRYLADTIHVTYILGSSGFLLDTLKNIYSLFNN